MVLLSLYKNNLYHNFANTIIFLEAVRQESSIMRKISRYITVKLKIFFFMLILSRKEISSAFFNLLISFLLIKNSFYYKKKRDNFVFCITKET